MNKKKIKQQSNKQVKALIKLWIYQRAPKTTIKDIITKNLLIKSISDQKKRKKFKA